MWHVSSQVKGWRRCSKTVKDVCPTSTSIDTHYLTFILVSETCHVPGGLYDIIL